MSKGVRVSPTLNQDRLAVIRKGLVTVSGLQRFIPASRSKAKEVYDAIAREIMLSEGKEVAWYGIEIDRVLKYFDMTEQDIRRWAKEEIELSMAKEKA